MLNLTAANKCCTLVYPSTCDTNKVEHTETANQNSGLRRFILYQLHGVSQTQKWTVNCAANITRQMLFIMVLLVGHYTTTCAGVGKTVTGEGRTGLGNLYQVESVDS